MIVFPDPPLIYGGDHKRVATSALTEIDGVYVLKEPSGWLPWPASQGSGPFTGLAYGGSGTDVTIQALEAGVEVEHLPDGVWGERRLPWLWARDRDDHPVDHMVYWQGQPFTGTVFRTDANGYVTQIDEGIDGHPIASVKFDHDGKVTAIETGERTTADGRTWSNDIRWEDGTVVSARSALWTQFSDTSRMPSELTVLFNQRHEIKSLRLRGPYLDIASCSKWDDAWIISSPDDFQGMQAAPNLRVTNIADRPDSRGDRWVYSVVGAMATDGGTDNVETLTITRNGFTAQQTIDLLDLGWTSLEKLEIGSGGYGSAIGYFGDYVRMVTQLKRERPELTIVLSGSWVAAENEHVPSGSDPYPTIIRLDPSLNHVVSMDNPDRQLSSHSLSSLEILDWLVAQPELKTVRLSDPARSYGNGEEHHACVEHISRIRPDVQLLIE